MPRKTGANLVSAVTDWLTVKEAARFAGVGPDTIRRWSDGGRVIAVRTAGGHRRVDADSLDQLIHHGGVTERDVAPSTAFDQMVADSSGWFGWRPPASWTVGDTERFIRSLDDIGRTITDLRASAMAHLDRIEN